MTGQVYISGTRRQNKNQVDGQEEKEIEIEIDFKEELNIGCVGDRSLKSLETSFNHILAILAYVIKLG